MRYFSPLARNVFDLGYMFYPSDIVYISHEGRSFSLGQNIPKIPTDSHILLYQAITLTL